MTDERTGICIYENGRFELRETDNAIIDLKGDFPPIMIAPDTVDDGSEPNCANARSVLHLLNELSDNNPNEEKHWYLKKMLDKSWKQYHEQKEENEQLKKELKSIDDSFKFSCTENHIEFNKDKLKVEDTHTELTLKDGKLCISVFIPQLNEYVKFFYLVTGRKMEREFINYDGDVE